MKHLLPIFTFILFISCENSNVSESKQKKKSEETIEFIAPENISAENLDTLLKGENIKGKIKLKEYYKDKSGGNIIVLSETGEYQSPNPTENMERDAELHAYNFKLLSDSGLSLKWEIKDFVKMCPVDIECEFVENSFEATDLDKDGILEFWTMYIVVCHGDVSPAKMKIIMYEGDQKHAMRGENKVEVSPGEFYGGEYKFDDAFESSPSVFREHAIKKWKKDIMMKW